MDAGEGFSSVMDNHIYAIDKIFLSHDHMDHIAGLTSFFGLRRAAMGDKTKPVTIYSTSQKALDLAKAIHDLVYQDRECTYNVEFVKLIHGRCVELGTNVYMEPFETNHCKDSAGLMVYRQSQRLKHVHRNDEFFLRQVKEGNRKVMGTHLETHYKPLIINALDNAGIDFSRNTFIPDTCELLIDDLTFAEGLKDIEYDEVKHNTPKGVAKNIKALNPKSVLLSHVSSRYMTRKPYKLRDKVVDKLRELGVSRDLEIEVFHPGRALHRPYTSDIKV